MNIVYLLDDADRMMHAITGLQLEIREEIKHLTDLSREAKAYNPKTRVGLVIIEDMLKRSRAVSAKIGELILLLETASLSEKDPHHDWMIHTARSLNVMRAGVVAYYTAYKETP